MTEEQKQEIAKSPEQLEIEEKAKLVDEYLDQLQRVQADFENYRKRAIKEKEEFRKYVLEGFLYQLLDIADNIQRAIDAAGKNHSYESLTNGINIVEKQFLELIKSQGVKPLDVKPGDKFDPHLHHAVGHEESDTVQTDHIIKIMQPGYTIGDRILRPAMVIVSGGKKCQSDNSKNEKRETSNEKRK